VAAFFQEEGAEFFEAEGGAEEGVVAELRVGVEREVGAVNGEIVVK
jgi:hypothetical protein